MPRFQITATRQEIYFVEAVDAAAAVRVVVTEAQAPNRWLPPVTGTITPLGPTRAERTVPGDLPEAE